jgi:outer membrane protein OmpA-like peptidoglycan-associated protein
MAQVVQVRTSPASVEAQTWAPQAHAHALELEQRAERALEQGDSASAELLAAHSVAAYEHAWVLTRLARAERRRLDAEAELRKERAALGELHAQHQRLSAEAAGLELRVQVAKGALALPPHEVAAPERMQARRRAAAALATQGRLLCVAARLLGESEGVRGSLARLDQLDQELGAGTGSRLLEKATELRAECLRVISEVRRPRAPAVGDAPAPAEAAPVAGSGARASADVTGPVPADMLLAELSAAGAMPSRDERGVSVVLRGLFGADGAVTATGRSELQRLGRVAKAHPDFPLLVVGHTGVDKPAPEVERQLGAVKSELVSSGVSRVEAHAAGQRQPLLPPQSPTARQRNERIELVFVAPGL